ncbi:MAG TPA: methyltransferase domain-containing protein [Bacillota bacterium]|jgi:SAM-dependent methyltransferase|nr:methyltransferase domain-containing protein [Fastidiosipila sp.]HPX93385.1 methyltransferase domain-containing protein [Bacillota bacterium]HQB80477.1 methyltransferase domain-containing protein [Bacillota bacterium]
MDSTGLFNERAGEYDAWYENNPLILAAEIEAVRQVTPPFEDALEVGVGTGRFAQALGVKLGLEPSSGMAAYARARGIEVVEGFAEALPFENESFDAVFMITVDCYLEELSPVLNECHRVLSPHGHLILGHVDIDAPLGAVYEEERDQDPFYKNAYFRGTKEMLTELDRAGFELVKIRQTVFTFENVAQEVREGHGDGVFVAMCAVKP